MYELGGLKTKIQKSFQNLVYSLYMTVELRKEIRKYRDGSYE